MNVVLVCFYLLFFLVFSFIILHFYYYFIIVIILFNSFSRWFFGMNIDIIFQSYCITIV